MTIRKHREDSFFFPFFFYFLFKFVTLSYKVLSHNSWYFFFAPSLGYDYVRVASLLKGNVTCLSSSTQDMTRGILKPSYTITGVCFLRRDTERTQILCYINVVPSYASLVYNWPTKWYISCIRCIKWQNLYESNYICMKVTINLGQGLWLR